jgi:SAM-dependent methyltransferase
MEEYVDLVSMALDWAKETIKENGKSVLWMDAATGAGNMTLKLARLFKVNGHVISVDKDEKSWTDWAYPKLAKENLLDVVTFKKLDLTDLSEMNARFHGIFSDMTLSVMGYSAIETISQFKKILLPHGRLIIRDYLPQSKAQNEDEEIANKSWCISKAIEVLSGQDVHDEFPPKFWVNYLKDFGFEINGFCYDDMREFRSRESTEEWLATPFDLNINESELENAIKNYVERLKEVVKQKGYMKNLSGTFLIMASLLSNDLS